MSTKQIALVLLVTVAIIVGSGHLAHAQAVGVDLPSVPGSVSATVTSPLSQVSVSWTASSESSGSIEGYYVYRNGVKAATTAGTSITDAGLGSGLYSYAVAAYDANGNVSAQSTAVSVSIMPDTAPPSMPANLTITGATTTNSSSASTTFTLSWTASSDDIGVAGYYVRRNGVSITPNASGAFTGTSMTDTVLPGIYTYSVTAYDAAQNLSKPATMTVIFSVDANPPSTPSNVSAQQISATSVSVSWASSTDSAGIASYQIFRNGVQVATATGSPYVDTGLSTDSTYIYRVAAYDTAGNLSLQSAPSPNVTIQTVSVPGMPYGLSAMLTNSSSTALSWAPSMSSLAIANYSIYRNGVQIKTVTSTYYLDTGLASGTYTYSVTATDISGAVSSSSATSSVVVPVYVPISVIPAPVFVAPSSAAGNNNGSVNTQALQQQLTQLFAMLLQLLQQAVKQGLMSSSQLNSIMGSISK